MEQFLIEGRISQKEALMISTDVLTGGIDTVISTAYTCTCTMISYIANSVYTISGYFI